MGTKNQPGEFDCYTNAEPDEPMFTLLGRDPIAPLLVEIWADVRAVLVGDGPKIAEARNCARTMRDWPVTKKLNHKIKPEEFLYWEIIDAIVQSYLGAVEKPIDRCSRRHNNRNVRQRTIPRE